MSPLSKRQKVRLAVAGSGALIMLAGAFTTVKQTVAVPSEAFGIAIPFGSIEKKTSLVGSVLGSVSNVGRKAGSSVTIRQFKFEQETEEVATLRASSDTDHIDFVVSPNAATVSDSAPLSTALQGRAFGYIYSSPDGHTENERQSEAGASMARKFPGTFFTNYRSSDITNWENANGISMVSADQLTLQKNARYIVVSNAATTFRVRKVQSPLNKSSMVNDVNNDGRISMKDYYTLNADVISKGARRVTSTMTAPPYLDPNNDWNINATDVLTLANWVNANPACGNSHIDTGEQCDDGNEVGGDGCSDTCQTERSLGDVTGDGTVSGLDTSMVSRHVLGLEALSTSALPYADVDLNGKIERADIFLIAGRAVSLITLPAKFGDMNADRLLQGGDTIMVQRNVAGTITLTTHQKYLADVNMDDHIDQKDIDLIQATIVQLSELPDLCGNTKNDTSWGEQCDDGNRSSSDGCSSTCQKETSPLYKSNKPMDVNNDGRITKKDYDAVTADIAARGARKVTSSMTAPPYLDTNNDWNISAVGDANTIGNWLNANPYCGNTRVETGETCDDGNEKNGDGCSELCAVETNPLYKSSMPMDVNNDGRVNQTGDYNTLRDDLNARGARAVTSGMTAPPYLDVNNDRNINPTDLNTLGNWLNSNPWCGNSAADAGEECDDGNTVNDDLCTNACRLPAAPF